MRLDGPQGQSGQVRKISFPTGIRSPDRPACSQSPYRLCYPAQILSCLRYIHYLLRWCWFPICVFIRVAKWQLMYIVELICTGDGLIMGTLHSVGIKLYVGHTEKTLVVSFIILLFVLCSASVNALQIFHKSLYAILTLQLPRLRFFHAFSSVVRQMPGYNSQRRGTARTFPN
jgi:hypothetical protein